MTLDDVPVLLDVDMSVALDDDVRGSVALDVDVKGKSRGSVTAMTGLDERGWHSYLWQGCLGILDKISQVGG